MNEQNKLNYPLNFNEMQYLNPDAKIITYDELNNVKDIKQIFRNTRKFYSNRFNKVRYQHFIYMNKLSMFSLIKL